MTSLRVVLSLQSRVSGTASFSALMAASRSRSASSSPSRSLRASSAASRSLLDLVDALDQALERMPRVEAGGPRVAVDVVLRKGRALRRMRELLLQEREVGGDLHGGSEVSPEGAGLQRGEEVVELGEVGVLAGLLLFDGFDNGGEPVLEIEWWELDLGAAHLGDGDGIQP